MYRDRAREGTTVTMLEGRSHSGPGVGGDRRQNSTNDIPPVTVQQTTVPKSGAEGSKRENRQVLSEE